MPAAVYNVPFFTQERVNFLRAEALHGVGRDDEALRWLNNAFFWWRGAVYYKAPVLHLAARIHEANGRPEEAPVPPSELVSYSRSSIWTVSSEQRTSPRTDTSSRAM